jgi:hypothetical protein
MLSFLSRFSRWTFPRGLSGNHISLRFSIRKEGKGKVAPVLNYLSTMPWRHMGEWRYSSTILDLGTRWKWVVACVFVAAEVCLSSRCLATDVSSCSIIPAFRRLVTIWSRSLNTSTIFIVFRRLHHHIYFGSSTAATQRHKSFYSSRQGKQKGKRIMFSFRAHLDKYLRKYNIISILTDYFVVYE